MALLKQIKESSLPLKSLFVASLAINLVLIISGLLAKFILPPEIPLFYGLPKNEEQLAPAIFVILPAVIALLTTTINIVVALSIDSLYLKRTMAFTSISVTILSIIATYKIIFLVGSI